MTGDLKLVLVDPSAAVTANNNPTAATNPQLIDTGLTAQPNAGSNAPDDTNVYTAFETGTVNSGTGAVTGIHSARMAYLKGGKIFTIDTAPGHSHTPAQVSNISNACGFSGGDATQLEDFANPQNSWLLVGQPGTDGSCYTSDDTMVAVKLTTASSAGGVVVAGLQGALALHDSAGAISGFLDGVLNGDGTLSLQHRDAAFANPATLATTASGTDAKVANAGISLIYFAYQPQGQSTYQLFSYNVTTGTLSGSLYTFVNGKPQGFKNSTANPNNFFFPDGDRLLRIPRGATASGQATLMTTLGGGLSIDGLSLTNNLRVVGSASGSGAGSLIFSVPNSASNVTATTVQNSGISGTTLTTAFLQSVDPSGLVYINLIVADTGTGSTSSSALLTHDDGTGSSSTANAQWVGEVDGADIANVQTALQTTPVAVLRDVMTNPSGSLATHTLTAVTSSTGAVLNSLGAIANCQGGGGFGIGRYVGIQAQVQHAGGPDPDAYFADIQTAASLKAASTVDGSDLYIGG